MNLDTHRIDEAMLALLHLGLHEDSRTWKSFDWDAMARLHEKGFISNPASKAKSIVFTEDGLRESKRLLSALFAMSSRTLLTAEFAREFADDWIDAWNSHELDRILSHYTEDFEMSSPLIVELAAEPSGTLRGKTAVRDYWTKALARLPDLRFELLDVLIGAGSVVIHYRGPRGASAEAFWFNVENKVFRAAAHYAGHKK
jgi:hypothetical protein